MRLSQASTRDIKAEYNKICCAMEQVEGLAFFSRDYKKIREWHVLGAVQNLLLRAGLDAPAFAEASETPDFDTYLPDGSRWGPLEVVEILRPDYKRQDFYTLDASPDAPKFHWAPPPLSQPWQPLREQIQRKANKNYPEDTGLIAYYDIGRFSFDDRHTPFDQQLLAENSKSPFVGADAFSRVFILSSDMGCLVQLHPQPLTIVPDTQ